MNRAHHAITCFIINEFESRHTHFLPNRWIDCNICLHHCLNLHTRRTHTRDNDFDHYLKLTERFCGDFGAGDPAYSLVAFGSLYGKQCKYLSHETGHSA